MQCLQKIEEIFILIDMIDSYRNLINRKCISRKELLPIVSSMKRYLWANQRDKSESSMVLI